MRFKGNNPLVNFAAATRLMPFINAAVLKSQLFFSEIIYISSKADSKTSMSFS